MEEGNSHQSTNATGVVMTRARHCNENSCMYKTLLVTLAASARSAGLATSAPAVRKEPLDAATLGAIKSRFQAATAHDAAIQMIDTSIVRVHQHGAGITRNQRQSMGRSRGGLTSKIHAVVDSNCLPVWLALSPGEAHGVRLAFVQLASIRLWLAARQGLQSVAAEGSRQPVARSAGSTSCVRLERPCGCECDGRSSRRTPWLCSDRNRKIAEGGRLIQARAPLVFQNLIKYPI